MCAKIASECHPHLEKVLEMYDAKYREIHESFILRLLKKDHNLIGFVEIS